MKSNYMNYFKDGKLYQWDKDMNVYTISKTTIQEEFCLDQKGMDMFLKFNNPIIKLGKTLTVKSGNVKANIKLSETTLVVPEFESLHTFTLPVDKLKTAVKYIATKDDRAILTGVNLGKGYINATDSFSAYRATMACKVCDITITKQFIDAISATKGEVEISCNHQMAVAKIEEVIYIGKLLAATYPSLARVYQNKGEKVCNCKKSELTQLLKYSMDSKDKVCLSKDRLRITGSTELDASIELNLDCEIIFPISKLNLALSTLIDEEIIINYSDGNKPVFFNEDILLLPIVKEV